MIALLAALALVPTPIGPGPAYVPASPGHTARCAAPRAVAHVELFANGRAIVIPAGIGACTDPARTRTPTGVVELSRAGVSLGDFFRVWGRAIGTHALLSFRSADAVQAFVNGRRVAGPIDSLQLTDRAEIVVELGGYVPPHTTFLFPKEPS